MFYFYTLLMAAAPLGAMGHVVARARSTTDRRHQATKGVLVASVQGICSPDLPQWELHPPLEWQAINNSHPASNSYGGRGCTAAMT